MADLLNIGRTGLVAARTGLEVTGENIANVDTEGYRRRDASQVELLTKQATPSTLPAYNQGVMVTNIRRAFDELLAARVRDSGGDLAAAEIAQPYLSQLEEIVLADGGGPQTILRDFFDGIDGLMTDPSDTGLRLVLIENGKALASSFSDMSRVLSALQQGVQGEEAAMVGKANDLLRGISELQEQIVQRVDRGAMNPLLDQRDLMLSRLSDIMDINVSYDERGLADVRMGRAPGGPFLLSGTRFVTLTQPASGRVTIPSIDPTGTSASRTVVSGALKGLADAYSTIAATLNDLDDIVGRVTRDMNAAHRSGITLDGEPGGDLFSLAGWAAKPALINGGTGVAVVTILDEHQMPDGPLELVFDAPSGRWRLNDSVGTLLAEGATQITLPGMTIEIDGTPTDGDRIWLTDTDGSALNMTYLLELPEQIAAAGPVVVSSGVQNTGSGSLRVALGEPVDSGVQDLSSLLSGMSQDALEFISPGIVGSIQPNAQSANLVVLPRLDALEVAFPSGDLLEDLSLDDGVNVHTFSAAPTLSSIDFVAALNDGTLTTAAGQTLADLGLWAVGEDDRLTIVAAEEFGLPTATLITESGTAASVVISDAAPASELSIFTREGRQLTGPPLTATEAAALITEANGFSPNALYDTSFLNEATGFGALTLDRMTAAGDEAVLAGANLNIEAWSGSAPTAARPAQTLGFDGGGLSIDVEIPAGASAMLAAQLLADALPVSVSARNAVALSPPATGALSFTLQGDNLDPVRISADLDADGLAGLAAAINVHTNATGVTAELNTAGSRLALIHPDGEDIVLESVDAGPLGLVRLDPDGQPLGTTTTLSSIGDTAARITGTVTLGSAVAFGLTEDGALRSSAPDPFLNGRVGRTVDEAGSRQTFTFPFDATLDGANGLSTGVGRYTFTMFDAAGDAHIISYDPALSRAASAAEVASGMAAAFRALSPPSMITGSPVPGSVPEGAQMRVTLGDQDYALRMTGGQLEVLGPEPERLSASFDANNRLVIATIGGDGDGAALLLPTDAGDAALFGMGMGDAPLTTLSGLPPDPGGLPASFDLTIDGADYPVTVSAGGITIPPGFPGTAQINGGTGAAEFTIDARAASVRVASQPGALAAGFETFGATLNVADGALSVEATDGRVLEISAAIAGSATHVSLDGLPNEELLVHLSGSGALRLAGDVLSATAPAADALDLRVLDAATGLIGIFDHTTGASLATRSLDASGVVTFGSYTMTLTGTLADGDSFTIEPNTTGVGDGRTLAKLSGLQQSVPGSDQGGFSAHYGQMLAEIGARVSAAEIRVNTAAAAKEAADRADAAVGAVNLDQEASKLLEQQQIYQANAQIMSVARQIFDTLLNAI